MRKCSKVCLLSFQTSFSISQSSTWPNGELFNWWTELFNQWRKIKSVVFSLKVALCNCACSTRGERRGGTQQGEFSLKVFNRRGGREGKGICREMRAELGKGGYCKVPVEFKFLQYCCGITHDTCDTYNTSRYYKVPAIPTILQVFPIHTILEKLLV